MITIRKLASLPRKTRLRKTILLLEGIERDCRAGRPVDMRYLREMARLLEGDDRLSSRIREAAAAVSGPHSADIDACRGVNTLRNALLAEVGRAPAEWDLLLPDGDRLDRSARSLRDFFVYLEDLRSPYNVGAVFRTAESFGVKAVFLSPDTPRPDHRRAERSAMGATRTVPWRVCTLEEAVSEAERVLGAAASQADAAGSRAASAQKRVQVFALETGGIPIETTELPEPGLAVLGSEELGVSAPALARADGAGGRVSISTAGAKASLNVAVAFGILAHSWWQKKAGRS